MLFKRLPILQTHQLLYPEWTNVIVFSVQQILRCPSCHFLCCMDIQQCWIGIPNMDLLNTHFSITHSQLLYAQGTIMSQLRDSAGKSYGVQEEIWAGVEQSHNATSSTSAVGTVKGEVRPVCTCNLHPPKPVPSPHTANTPLHRLGGFQICEWTVCTREDTNIGLVIGSYQVHYAFDLISPLVVVHKTPTHAHYLPHQSWQATPWPDQNGPAHRQPLQGRYLIQCMFQSKLHNNDHVPINHIPLPLSICWLARAKHSFSYT